MLLKQVPDPQRYGVAELRDDAVVGIEEKPRKPRSDWAVAGIYLYPGRRFRGDSDRCKPSARGELEITDVNNHYLRQGRLSHHLLEGYWTDAGTLESLAHANQLVHAQPPSF